MAAGWILFGAGAPAVAGEERASDAEPEAATEMGDLFELGRLLFETFAPEEILREYRFPTTEEWNQFWRSIDAASETGNLEELAWILPEARVAVGLLRQHELGEFLADWLEPRLAYLEMAHRALAAIPEGRERVRPEGLRQPGAGLAPPSRDPVRAPLSAPARQQTGAFLRFQRNWEEEVRKHPPPPRAASLLPRLKRIFREEGVPEELVWLAEVESSFNPRARSPAGARGLFQLMPATAEGLGLRLRPLDQRDNPEANARAAARYLKSLYNRFGSWELALAAYNAGQGRVGRLLQAGGRRDFSAIAGTLPAETQMFVPRVLATVAVREGIDSSRLPPPRG
ncbi:MAG: lytic transglycosylase domain-containing protein [Puniceicoccaceae bacterium]|nr:MAG: lytic transglycosylase domain-containing protein [Puniceicoccaceae bacterium]